jgi:CBS domain-containing protein
LTATDFMRRTGDEQSATRFEQAECVCSDWQIVAPVDDLISSHMTADPVTVVPGTPIYLVARRMLNAHVHRVIVVDEDGRPIGIVTSTDILAAVARAGVAV